LIASPIPAVKMLYSSAAASSSTLPKLTYATLEAEINKWAYQLEEQENIFIHQATQVNAWDRLLLESGDKVYFTLQPPYFF
jgi:nuclear pore complex protein Nup62